MIETTEVSLLSVLNGAQDSTVSHTLLPHPVGYTPVRDLASLARNQTWAVFDARPDFIKLGHRGTHPGAWITLELCHLC